MVLVGETERPDVEATGENDWKEGVNVGASAFKVLWDPELEALGIATGSALAEEEVGRSRVTLVDLDPAELPLPGPEVGGRVFRSEIIFCKLARASPPVCNLCFSVAASTAASIAVRGADTAA